MMSHQLIKLETGPNNPPTTLTHHIPQFNLHLNHLLHLIIFNLFFITKQLHNYIAPSLQSYKLHSRQLLNTGHNKTSYLLDPYI